MYAELHAHSYFSFLDGVSSPQALATRASQLGISHLAVTDHNGIYGVMPFVRACLSSGITPIVGAEITLEDSSHLTFLVQSEVGWANLCHLLTVAHANAPKGEARLKESELEQHSTGLILLSGCRKGKIARLLFANSIGEAHEVARRYKAWFGKDNFFIELQFHHLPHDQRLNERLVALSTSLELHYVATNNVHYARQDDQDIQDVVTCIRTHTTLSTSKELRYPNSEYHLKPPSEMATLFRNYPEAIETTLEIAKRCTFIPQFGLQDLPVIALEGGETASTYLEARCFEELHKRFPEPSSALALLAHELTVIESAGLSNYFLLVADIVAFAKGHGIRCQGRGSASNSLVAYLLQISPVDPITHNLVFERFLSEERVSVPDIDLDFDASRREEVIQYVYEKYGREHSAMACTFVTYRRRSSVREVGKALGLSPHLIDEAISAIELDRDLPDTTPYARELVRLVNKLRGNPRHVGIHNGGMILMGSLLSSRLVVEPATMQARTVVQWDKEALEDAGIVKVDILGLRMLSAIDEAVQMVRARGIMLDVDELPFDDPAIYEMLTQADTIGVFQVESRAQAQTLPRLKPKTFNDVVVSISLIRPGPVQGNMVHPYLRRRRGAEPVEYPHVRLENALEETLGVILFQEQVLKISHDLAGFTHGQGEVLRRALGSKNAPEAIEALREAFVTGAVKQDVLEHIAQDVFDKLTAFGGYSFPKSHATAFAVLVYQSAYLKRYHPAEFLTAILNYQPMGFWSPAVVANDARRHGIALLGLDVNKSGAMCTVENGAIRLGFSYVKGIGQKVAKEIEEARGSRPFRSLGDFIRRTKLVPRLLTRLITVGCFDRWERNRRKVLWEVHTITQNDLGLHFADEHLDLTPYTSAEEFALEAQYMGVTTGEHIMSLYKTWVKKNGILSSRDLAKARPGTSVQVAGEVVMHQSPPTAKGFHFITLEDQWGMINVIVKPRVYNRYKRILRHSPLLWVTGTVQWDEGVVNVICERARHIAT